MKYLILGVGAAGVQAAQTLRANSPQAEIMMVSSDQVVHSRCLLHTYISGTRDEKGISFIPEDFFTSYKISWREGVAAKHIDPGHKQVTLEDGSVLDYGKLLIATGAESIIPPIPGLREADNVHGLRHLSDAQTISRALDRAERAVVIGSGLVGLDAAYALLERGKQVSVVEMAEQVLPLNLDARAAATYQEAFVKAGCEFYLGRKVVEGKRNRQGRISQVMLDDGRKLPCDLVICAAGVKPALGLLEGSGIQHLRGISVDSHLRTSAPDVYAAGDITALSGIWPNAAKQGEVAALNMCGKTTEYNDTFSSKNTVNFYGLKTLALGELRPQGKDVLLVQEDRQGYKKLILRDNHVVGLVLQGDISHSGLWQYLIKDRVNVGGLQKSLFSLSFADFYQLDRRGQYHWA